MSNINQSPEELTQLIRDSNVREVRTQSGDLYTRTATEQQLIELAKIKMIEPNKPGRFSYWRLVDTQSESETARRSIIAQASRTIRRVPVPGAGVYFEHLQGASNPCLK